ncbi:MAG TPA: TIGR03032 family protein [Tepidisphaeraceae bacterium]|jgi:uncharacterized protein (TIGR03032 family)
MSETEATSKTESPAAETEKAAAPAPLRSVHTGSVAQILGELGCSLMVSTYQAGKLVILRNDGPMTVNTHFRSFEKPMGIAISGDRMAIGTARQITEFHNVPAVAPKVEPPGKCDAAYLPRVTHHTGDIQIHEMAFAGTELVFVNTRFSCLCTRSPLYSFVPRWRPKFVTELAAEDRCHLNGLAIRDDKPRYVTALGRTNTQGGWRDNKKSGGIIIDIPSGEIIVEGLSMPHSPRYHNGKLWVLNSGSGGLGYVDLMNGQYTNVCKLPGFTRGFDFAGPFAFVGLSQVRESAVFSGIEIAELPLEQRSSGVWIVDLRNGRIAGYVKFEEAVQEIFAVQVLKRKYPDVIVEVGPTLSGSFVLPDEALKDVSKGHVVLRESENPDNPER